MTVRLGVDQRPAAALEGVPIRVVAGAGTGKTAVIAERFRRLVRAGVAPSSILVMTFTERAAAEMRTRIEDLIGTAAPWVGTFHSIALRWLRADGAAVGVAPGFRILAGADRWILARELMWRIGDNALTGDERPDDLVAPALGMLERMKQELVPITRLEKWAARESSRAASPDSVQEEKGEVERAELMRACARLFRAYDKECRIRQMLDFEDLLVLAVRMLDQGPQLRHQYATRFPHVLVDEFQDLNLAQERLVELVATGGEPFVVGDDDQSIYRFRGASRASLERFQDAFPSARTITMGHNRRSSRHIVAAAASLIANNTGRIPKELRSTGTGPAVEIWRCADGFTEATSIASHAAELVERGTSPRFIAVLCRTNATARPIAAALAALALPHVVIGGRGFHDRPEIRDVIALLRVLRDTGDVVALARAVTRSPVSLDATAALGVLRDRGAATPLEALKSWPPSAAFAHELELLAADAYRLDVQDLFFELMNRTGYLQSSIRSLEAGEAARVVANVGRFAETIAEFCETATDRSLVSYIDHLDLVLLSGEDEEPAAVEGTIDAIQVMTIHQAKGLEFDSVFVPGLVEGRLPQSGRSPRFELPAAFIEPLVRGREDVVAEERRLLYVAMTRARRRLYLTRAEHYDGGRRWRHSRFLDEVKAAGPRVVTEREIATRPNPAPKSSARRIEGGVVLSYSAITAYRDCPRQYWYRQEQRLPAAQSAEAVHGVILHEVLRQAGEIRRGGRTITAALLSEILARAWATTPFPDARRAPTFKRIGAAQLELYRQRGGLESVPEHLEQSFSAAVDGWTLRGVIDRIDRTESGWRIIDYKSGRPLTRSRRDMQVALYALGAKSALRLDPLELEVVYLASGESVEVDKVDALVADATSQAAEVAEGVRAGRFEAKPERRRCRLCPYRLACAEAL